MIDEKILSENFSYVWKSCFPILTPAYITLLNNSRVIQIKNAVVPKGENSRWDVVAEYGFNLTRKSLEGKQSLSKIDASPTRRKKILVDIVNDLYGNSKDEVELSQSERNEALLLAQNLRYFLKREYQLTGTQFNPVFSGDGLIPRMAGDISITDSTLIEVKTVSRGFRSVDVRQCLLYLALSSQMNISYDNLVIFNPSGLSRV